MTIFFRVRVFDKVAIAALRGGFDNKAKTIVAPMTFLYLVTHGIVY